MSAYRTFRMPTFDEPGPRSEPDGRCDDDGCNGGLLMYDYMHPKDGPVFEGLESLEIVYAKDQPQYIPLRTVRSASSEACVLSRWEPTPEQRKAIAEGADIILSLSTFGGPLQPIRMAVTNGQLDTDWVRVCLLDMPAEKNVADDVVVRPDDALEETH